MQESSRNTVPKFPVSGPIPFLEDFAKLKKKKLLASSCKFVRPPFLLFSVANLLPKHGFFENISRNFKVDYNMAIKRDTSKEGLCKFMVISY
jgi:hypothetical protein